MVNCSIRKCKSRSKKGISTIQFHSFPQKESVANEWFRYCGLKTTRKHGRVCSKHFTSSDYTKSLRHILMNESPRTLKPDAIPTLEIPNIPIDGVEKSNSTDLAANSTICTEGLTDNCVSKEYCEISAPSCNIKFGTTVHIKCEPDIDTTVNNAESSLNIVEESSSDKKITMSEAEYKLLKRKANECDILKNNLKQIFTPGQIRCLTKPDRRRVRWSAEDIAAAISLRSVTPKGYRHLRTTVGIPLPAVSTLCQWASKFEIEAGVLENVITLMKLKAKGFNSLEKLVSLSFDEICLSNRIENDKNQQTVPYHTCQCIMARGLCGKWTQPVYFQYDQKMTKEILFEVIIKLHNAGFTVTTLTCDIGTANPGLLRSLNIGIEESQLTYFQHPSDSNLKVHVFFDVPHLLKLARNHFIDHGFEYVGKMISKKTIEKVLSLSADDLKIAHKITPQHLNVVGSQRQKVDTAAQLFSNTTARTIEWCGINHFLPGENWLELSYILRGFNDWFDVLNTRMNEGNKAAYGLNLEAQNFVLDKMNDLTKNIKTGKKMSNQNPFQIGILITNKSLLNLFQDLTERFQLEYILTDRLNQDILENFFSYIRGMGATNDHHPTALSFKHRLKWYILGKHASDVFKAPSSTLEDPSIACLISPLDNPGTSSRNNPLEDNIVDEERVETGDKQLNKNS